MNNEEIKIKAKKLVEKYKETIMSFLSDNMKHENAKKCAIIDVQNTIDELEDLKQHIDDNDRFFINTKIDGLTAIKQAIENL
jgi:hypothetical protein